MKESYKILLVLTSGLVVHLVVCAMIYLGHAEMLLMLFSMMFLIVTLYFFLKERVGEKRIIIVAMICIMGISLSVVLPGYFLWSISCLILSVGTVWRFLNNSYMGNDPLSNG